MKRFYQRMMAFILALSLTLAVSHVALAEGATNPSIPLVSLGDSIATGYGLANYNPLDLTKAKDAYINLLGVSMGITPVNLAKDGLTSGGLLVLLEEAQVKEQLAAAEVITLSIGGNNVLKPMIESIKNEFGLISTATDSELAKKINSLGLTEAIKKGGEALVKATPDIEKGLADFQKEFPLIMAQIKVLAPQATLYVSTLYTAYGGVKLEGFDLDAATTAPIKAINEVIVKTLAEPPYSHVEMVDVASAFGNAPSQKRYVNVNIFMGNFDPHPAIAGHQVMFELYVKPLVKDYVSFNLTDISKHSARDSIRYLAGLGIVSGNNGLFLPDDRLTRAQYIKILYGAVSGKPAVKANAFLDVPKGMWYEQYVNWASQNNVTTGIGGNKFGPNNNISRQDLTVMLYRLLDANGYEMPVVPVNERYADDAQIAGYAKEAIYALKAAGFLVEKTGDKFNPTAQATRAETVTILANYVRAVR